jgi:hypothetical protein
VAVRLGDGFIIRSCLLALLELQFSALFLPYRVTPLRMRHAQERSGGLWMGARDWYGSKEARIPVSGTSLA